MKLKPYIAMYEGHDVSISIWDPNTNEFVVYELERITQDKHYMVSQGVGVTTEGNYVHKRSKKKEDINFYISFALANLKKDFGIENDFQIFHIMPTHPQNPQDPLTWDYSIINAPVYHISRANHHEAHSWSSYMQAPFKNSAIISWDAGGDNTLFMYSEINEQGYMTKRFEYPVLRYSFMWQLYGVHMESIRHTVNALDYAGKMMGLAAYGLPFEEKARSLVPEILSMMERMEDKDVSREKVHLWLKENFNQQHILHGDDEKTLAYAIQLATEEGLIQFIRNELIDMIHLCDNNLIITGGTAMNILVNERVKKEFPELNVFVPCNPGDDNISCGLMSREMWFLQDKLRHNMINGTFDFKYAGPYLFDHNNLMEYVIERNARETTLTEVAELLRNGKIIGFLNGRSEVGPRALGNRSILCDPTIPDMKNKLNQRVKFREWFRPFAPVCRLVDADKYFDSRDYDFMDAMQFAVDVKPEWQSTLTEITHADGTARLQTVTEESNPVFYELLNEFDGVLLNTSFNIQGKPILNSIRDALEILDTTQLDHVVVVNKDDNKPYIFSKGLL